MSRSNFLHSLQYCKYYCEENIWQLCAQSKFADNAWVLFVSNKKNQFVIWNQKLAEFGEPVVWDYHVILLAKENEKFNIFDFDTRSPFGVDAGEYFSNSFPDAEIPEHLSPNFLIQSAPYFRQHFKSNREHMKGADGRFLKPEPSWEKISMTSNLNQYLEMNDKKDYIISLDEIRETSWDSITERCHS